MQFSALGIIYTALPVRVAEPIQVTLGKMQGTPQAGRQPTAGLT